MEKVRKALAIETVKAMQAEWQLLHQLLDAEIKAGGGGLDVEVVQALDATGMLAMSLHAKHIAADASTSPSTQDGGTSLKSLPSEQVDGRMGAREFKDGATGLTGAQAGEVAETATMVPVGTAETRESVRRMLEGARAEGKAVLAMVGVPLGAMALIFTRTDGEMLADSIEEYTEAMDATKMLSTPTVSCSTELDVRIVAVSVNGTQVADSPLAHLVMDYFTHVLEEHMGSTTRLVDQNGKEVEEPTDGQIAKVKEKRMAAAEAGKPHSIN